jgi:hypothetical protein
MYNGTRCQGSALSHTHEPVTCRRYYVVAFSVPRSNSRASHRRVSLSDGIGIVQPYTLLEFVVRKAKSVLALLSVIGRISVATRWFVRSYRFGYTEMSGVDRRRPRYRA